MSDKELTVAEEEAKAKVVEQKKWRDLDRDERAVVVAELVTAKVKDAYDLVGFKSSKYHQIKRKIAPLIDELQKEIPSQALQVLAGGSVMAARELVDELRHFNIDVRHRAAVAILDRVSGFNPDKEGKVQVGVQVNLADRTAEIRRERGLDVKEGEIDDS